MSDCEWTDAYSGSGNSELGTFAQSQPVPWCRAPGGESLDVHGRMPGNPEATDFGARMTADTVCSKCGRGFAAGDFVEIVCAPKMAGTFHHRDCPT